MGVASSEIWEERKTEEEVIRVRTTGVAKDAVSPQEKDVTSVENATTAQKNARWRGGQNTRKGVYRQKDGRLQQEAEGA
jgi:hypothetical protein